MTFELWRLVAVKDATHSTWELVGNFKTPKQARNRILELAGPTIVSSDEQTISYQDSAGEHTFRIEAVPVPAPPQT